MRWISQLTLLEKQPVAGQLLTHWETRRVRLCWAWRKPQPDHITGYDRPGTGSAGQRVFYLQRAASQSRMLQSHFDYLRPIITHRYPISAIQEAFQTFFAGSTGKVIIEQ